MKQTLMGKPAKHLDESPDNGMKLLFSKNFIISYVSIVPKFISVDGLQGREHKIVEFTVCSVSVWYMTKEDETTTTTISDQA